MKEKTILITKKHPLIKAVIKALCSIDDIIMEHNSTKTPVESARILMKARNKIERLIRVLEY